MASFWGNLIALGFKSYSEYLASPHWQRFKKSYRSSHRPRRCEICNNAPIQLHHNTYQRLGVERLDDVTPLCREHHTQVHKIIKERRWPIEWTCKAIAIIKLERQPKTVAARPPISAKSAVAKTEKKSRQLLTKKAEAVAEFVAIAKQGHRHPIVPANYQPDANDFPFERYLKLMRRAKLRAEREDRVAKSRKWRQSTRVVKATVTPDFTNESIALRALAAGFRLPR